MCIIILKPKGTKIPEDKLREAWKDNPNGSGFTFVDPSSKKFMIRKELSDLERLINIYKKELVDTELEEKVIVMWHSRIKSVGDINYDNIHPFYMPKHRMMVAHNGTLWQSDVIKRNIDKSDTVQAVEWADENLPFGFFTNETCREMFANYFNKTDSRLVFLNKDNYFIINEDKGEWKDGLWFSKKPIAVVTNSRYYQHGRDYYEDVDYGDDYYGYRKDKNYSSVWRDREKYVITSFIDNRFQDIEYYITQKAMIDLWFEREKKEKEKKKVRVKKASSYTKDQFVECSFDGYCWNCGSEIHDNNEKEYNKCIHCHLIGQVAVNENPGI